MEVDGQRADKAAGWFDVRGGETATRQPDWHKMREV